MQDLIEKLNEQYQDICHDGKMYPGKRDCLSRWEIIKDYIPEGVIIEIGSSQGYFTQKMADLPNRIIVSMEQEEASVEIQKKLLKNKINVAICKVALTEKHLYDWSQAVETIDMILLLSILHHFENPERILQCVSQISPCAIIEIPHKDEINACGQESIDKITKIDLKKYYSEVIPLGSSPSHVNQEFKRKIFLCKNSLFEKGELFPYIGCPYKERAVHYLNKSNGMWILDGKGIVPAVNVQNLLRFGLQHPSSKWFKEQWRIAYQAIFDPTDIRPWNLIFTGNGLKAIDFEERPEDGSLDIKPGYDIEMDRAFNY